MPWIPLQEWQPGYEPKLDTISAGSADFVDSTIVFTGVTNKSTGAFAYAFWYAYDIGGFIPGETVRVRVECTRAEWETYTAPSDPNVRLVSSSLPDIQTVWAGGVPATFDIELVNTADPQGEVDLWMQWGSGSGGTLFTGGNFEFRISVWMEDPLPPDPEPVGCFWTDLVNVTQVCGETPPEPEYPMEVTLRCHRGPPTPAGYTHSTGLDPTDSFGSPRSYAALAGAVSVELLAVSKKELPPDSSSFSEWSAPLPLDDGYFDGATVLDPPGIFVVNEYGYWTFGSNDPSVGDWRVGVVRVTTADSVAMYSVLFDWGGFG